MKRSIPGTQEETRGIGGCLLVLTLIYASLVRHLRQDHQIERYHPHPFHHPLLIDASERLQKPAVLSYA